MWLCAELIDLMTHLSIDRAANGHTLAVAMYATLPYYFRDFEQELAGSMLTGRASRGATVYEHELANIIGSKFLKRECSDEHEKVTTLARVLSTLEHIRSAGDDLSSVESAPEWTLCCSSGAYK